MIHVSNVERGMGGGFFWSASCGAGHLGLGRSRPCAFCSVVNFVESPSRPALGSLLDIITEIKHRFSKAEKKMRDGGGMRGWLMEGRRKIDWSFDEWRIRWEGRGLERTRHWFLGFGAYCGLKGENERKNGNGGVL